jgi:hypothetical protein
MERLSGGEGGVGVFPLAMSQPVRMDGYVTLTRPCNACELRLMMSERAFGLWCVRAPIQPARTPRSSNSNLW